MRRGYVRTVWRNPATRQREALEAAGVTPIYDDATPEDVLASLRPGDELAIAGALTVLADKRATLHHVMAQVREQGATIVDVISGRTASDAGAEMAIEALDEMGRRRASHLDQSKAARKRWGKETRPTPIRQAIRAWRDVASYPNAEAALASDDMEGWTRTWAYRKLGKRFPPYGDKE